MIYDRINLDAHLGNSIWVKRVNGLGGRLGGARVILLVQSVLSKYLERMMMLSICSRFIMNTENDDAWIYFVLSASFPWI